MLPAGSCFLANLCNRKEDWSESNRWGCFDFYFYFLFLFFFFTSQINILPILEDNGWTWKSEGKKKKWIPKNEGWIHFKRKAFLFIFVRSFWLFQNKSIKGGHPKRKELLLMINTDMYKTSHLLPLRYLFCCWAWISGFHVWSSQCLQRRKSLDPICSFPRWDY